MQLTEMQFYRVRAYQGYGAARNMVYSFRVAATSSIEATEKVIRHIGDQWEIIAKPAGKEEFWQ